MFEWVVLRSANVCVSLSLRAWFVHIEDVPNNDADDDDDDAQETRSKNEGWCLVSVCA